MKYLPTENITYKTILSEEEVIKRLSDMIEPEKKFRMGFWGSGSTKPYEGEINEDEFNIKRIINYRNSFLPRINGMIEKTYNGTTIHVKMRLHTFVQIFLCFWLGSAAMTCIVILIQAFNNAAFALAALIPFGMFLFGCALTMGCFKYESNRSKKDLHKIFEGEIIQ